MSRTRVLFVQHAATPSGAALSLGILVKGLDAERYDPVIACIHPTSAIRDYYAKIGIPIVSAEGVREFPHTTARWLRLWNPRDLLTLVAVVAAFPLSVRAAGRLMARERPDVVHLNSLVLVPAAVAARRLGVPLVWHVRESAARGHLGLRRRWLARQVRELPDAAIFLSRDDMGRLGSHPDWSVIPNVADFEPSGPHVDRERARHELGIPMDARVVLFLGGYSLVKGILVLLEAIPKVAAAVPELRCLVVGAHPPSRELGPRLARKLLPLVGLRTPRQRVEGAIKEAGDHVAVLPWRTDVGRLFAVADVLVFPSVEPHFPRPVIEAFTHRVPVVASEIEGVRELIEDGVTGRLVRPSDPNALAQTLIEVLSDRSLARRLTDTAYELGRQRFDPAARIGEISSIYVRILSARGLPATMP
jgi:glycosyltransferase involved in cell wall biosynthesis